MQVAFTTKEAPVFDTIEESLDLFYGMAEGLVPVFAVDDVDTVDEQLVQALLPFTSEYQLALDPRSSPFKRLGSTAMYGQPESEAEDFVPDFDLHIDGRPGEKEVDISLHRTEYGRADASFFEPTDTFIAANLDAARFGLKGRVTPLFGEGKVDDRMFVPVRHHVECVPRRLVVFRRGGARPVGHIFRTTEYPRLSDLRWLNSAPQ